MFIARFSGGNNAGHTVSIGGETYKLHLVPSGTLYKDKLAVISNQSLIDCTIERIRRIKWTWAFLQVIYVYLIVRK